MLKNKVYLVLDDSGSMSSLRQQAITVANDVISTLVKEAKRTRQKTDITVITFGKPDNINVIYKDKKHPVITNSDYHANDGSTALYDGTAKAINLGFDSDDVDDEDTSFLVIVVTDGEENSSKKYSAQDLTRLIKQADKYGNWTITFQVPKSLYSWHSSPKQKLINAGISADNIREWEVSKEGLRDVERTTSLGISSYYGARASGQRSVKTFYTDLSGLPNKVLKNTLDNVSDDFDAYKVDRDSEIRNFIERKTGRTYIKGESYYQLTKPELVQENKEILVYNTMTDVLYSGDDARQVLGLPVRQRIKVVPLDHERYEIFVQSTSVNRKLVKGTKVLVKK